MSGEGEPGLRARQRAATSLAIEQAALRLFAERGFDGVTADHIAEAAGVSVRTYFRHFPEGKEGVVLLETRRGIQLLEEAFRRRPPHEPAMVAMRAAALDSVMILDRPSPPDGGFGLEQAMDLFGQIVARHPALHARMMGERLRLMEPLVEQVALRMSLDPDVDVRPRLLVHAAHAAITVAWLTYFANRDLDRYALLEEGFDVLEAGLGAEQPDVAARR